MAVLTRFINKSWTRIDSQVPVGANKRLDLLKSWHWWLSKGRIGSAFTTRTQPGLCADCWCNCDTCTDINSLILGTTFEKLFSSPRVASSASTLCRFTVQVVKKTPQQSRRDKFRHLSSSLWLTAILTERFVWVLASLLALPLFLAVSLPFPHSLSGSSDDLARWCAVSIAARKPRPTSQRLDGVSIISITSDLMAVLKRRRRFSDGVRRSYVFLSRLRITK